MTRHKQFSTIFTLFVYYSLSRRRSDLDCYAQIGSFLAYNCMTPLDLCLKTNFFLFSFCIRNSRTLTVTLTPLRMSQLNRASPLNATSSPPSPPPHSDTPMPPATTPPLHSSNITTPDTTSPSISPLSPKLPARVNRPDEPNKDGKSDGKKRTRPPALSLRSEYFFFFFSPSSIVSPNRLINNLHPLHFYFLECARLNKDPHENSSRDSGKDERSASPPILKEINKQAN